MSFLFGQQLNYDELARALIRQRKQERIDKQLNASVEEYNKLHSPRSTVFMDPPKKSAFQKLFSFLKLK